jgi:hypothetical protein
MQIARLALFEVNEKKELPEKRARAHGSRNSFLGVQISFQSRFTGDFDGRRARRTAFLVCV